MTSFYVCVCVFCSLVMMMMWFPRRSLVPRVLLHGDDGPGAPSSIIVVCCVYGLDGGADDESMWLTKLT